MQTKIILHCLKINTDSPLLSNHAKFGKMATVKFEISTVSHFHWLQGSIKPANLQNMREAQ